MPYLRHPIFVKQRGRESVEHSPTQPTIRINDRALPQATVMNGLRPNERVQNIRLEFRLVSLQRAIISLLASVM